MCGGCSLPGSGDIALKIAHTSSKKAEALQAEIDAYMVLEEVWGAAVPRLMLAGEMQAHGHGIVLGTEFLKGRRLRTGITSCMANLAVVSIACSKNVHAH